MRQPEFRAAAELTRPLFFALLSLTWLAESALAHDLQYQAEEGRAVYLKLYFPGSEDFSFEAYEVYRQGEEIPFQVGRTDCYGRLAFLADRPGKWRIKAFSENAHGLDAFVTTGLGGCVERAGGPALGRDWRILVGVALIFGFFGTVNLFGGWRRVR